MKPIELGFYSEYFGICPKGICYFVILSEAKILYS